MGFVDGDEYTVNVTISGENQWTDWIKIGSWGAMTLNNTDLVATVSLESKDAGDATGVEADTLSVSATTNGVYEFRGHGKEWRVGVATGDYTSGGAVLKLKDN